MDRDPEMRMHVTAPMEFAVMGCEEALPFFIDLRTATLELELDPLVDLPQPRRCTRHCNYRRSQAVDV
jgi:hypothetical protein